MPEVPNHDEPLQAVQGKNSWGRIGYGGPHPPKGYGRHHYHFTLYVLDKVLGAGPGMDKAALLKTVEESVLTKATRTGTY